MLSQLGERRIPAKKADRAAALMEIWSKSPQRILDGLSATERLLLADLVHYDRYCVDLERFTALYGQPYKWPSRWEREKPCVIYFFFGAEDRGSVELMNDVQRELKHCLTKPPALKLKGQSETPTTGCWQRHSVWSDKEETEKRDLCVYEAEHTALAELRRVLQLCLAGKLKVSTATRLPTAASTKAVGAVLVAPDLDLDPPDPESIRFFKSATSGPVRSFAWPVLLQQCGWARARAGSLSITSEGRALLDAFEPKQFRRGIQKWIDDGHFDEMRRIQPIKGQTGKYSRAFQTDLPARRTSILSALSQLPEGMWVEVEEAYRGLLASDGDCRPFVETYGLYLCDAQYGTLGGHSTDIGRIYFRYVLGESLATLGLVDITYTYPYFLFPELNDNWGRDAEPYNSRMDGLKHIRLTPLGQFCVGLSDDYTLPTVESQPILTVLPNLEITVTDPAAFSPTDAMQLDGFAKRVSDCVWRMDRNSLLAALERGDTSEHIFQTLEAFSQKEIPDTVRGFINEAANRAGLVKAQEDAVLVHFADEPTAATVLSDSSAGRLALCRHGPTVVVPGRRIRAFASACKKMGILLTP